MCRWGCGSRAYLDCAFWPWRVGIGCSTIPSQVIQTTSKCNDRETHSCLGSTDQFDGLHRQVPYSRFHDRSLRTIVWKVVVSHTNFLYTFSSILFGSYHIYQGLLGAGSAVFFGMVFGTWFVWTRRLGALIVAHTICNLLHSLSW